MVRLRSSTSSHPPPSSSSKSSSSSSVGERRSARVAANGPSSTSTSSSSERLNDSSKSTSTLRGDRGSIKREEIPRKLAYEISDDEEEEDSFSESDDDKANSTYNLRRRASSHSFRDYFDYNSKEDEEDEYDTSMLVQRRRSSRDVVPRRHSAPDHSYRSSQPSRRLRTLNVRRRYAEDSEDEEEEDEEEEDEDEDEEEEEELRRDDRRSREEEDEDEGVLINSRAVSLRRGGREEKEHRAGDEDEDGDEPDIIVNSDGEDEGEREREEGLDSTVTSPVKIELSRTRSTRSGSGVGGEKEEGVLEETKSSSREDSKRRTRSTAAGSLTEDLKDDEIDVAGVKVGTYSLRGGGSRAQREPSTSSSTPSKKANDGRRRSFRKKSEVKRFNPVPTTKRRRTSSKDLFDIYLRSSKRSKHHFEYDDETNDLNMFPSSDSWNSDSKYSDYPTPINMPRGGSGDSSSASSLFGGGGSGGRGKDSKGDVDPMTIDPSINWNSIGGLDHHVKLLKEMVMFPLLYPEIFQRFNITPPRGVLFYGPPGCGKTLVARALANTCVQAGQSVAFFMRKGADCLSKYVGEAERQLRMLFEQAYRMQPSIIFFDEIDGLAPVRSSRQDQIHNSIVSTLLALMDGLDDRGRVVVIGATNRIDTIDPALRRPGRFDRELLFTLPSKVGRRSILDIHTRNWSPPLPLTLKEELSSLAVGYCGADIKALCTEAALQALRRSYPQIYDSAEKLLIDVNSIQVTRQDFVKAMKIITPTAHRAANSFAKPLPLNLKPLLDSRLNEILEIVKDIFPFLSSQQPKKKDEDEDMYEDVEEGPSTSSSSALLPPKLTSTLSRPPKVHRPRLMIHGEAEMGQAQAAAALLNHLEEFSIFSLDFATLNSDTSAKILEEALARVLSEAKRKLPAVIYIPHAPEWWRNVSPAMQLTLSCFLQDMDPSCPLFLIMTSDIVIAEDSFSEEFMALLQRAEYFEMLPPDSDSRRIYFEPTLLEVERPPVSRHEGSRRKVFLPLPKAPPPVPVAPTAEQLQQEEEEEEHALRDLRISLRSVLESLFRERKFKPFFYPVDGVPDYHNIIANPICLLQMREKIDSHEYLSLEGFLDDIRLLVANAEQYNATSDPVGIIPKARALLDHTFSVARSISTRLVLACRNIAQRRLTRNGLRTHIASASSSTFAAPVRRSARIAKGDKSEDTEKEIEEIVNSPPPPSPPTSSSSSSSISSTSSASSASSSSVGRYHSMATSQVAEALRIPEAEATAISAMNGLFQGLVASASPLLPSGEKTTRTEEEEEETGTNNLALTLTEERKQPTPEFVLDRSELDSFSQKLIDKTSGYSVEQLHSLNVELANCIKKHFEEFNRTEMLKELEEVFDADLKAREARLRRSVTNEKSLSLSSSQNSFSK